MGRRPNGEGSYYYNESRKFWEYKYPYIVNGKKKYKKFTAKTKKDIKNKVDQFKSTLTNNNDTLTLGIWLRQWLNTYVEGHVKTTTEERYKLAVEKHIIPFIGNEPLSSLTSVKVQTFINELYKTGSCNGSTLSARTVNNARMILNNALKRAMGDNMIDRNPVTFTKPIKAAIPKIHVLSIDECQKLVISASQEPNKAMAIAIIIALETGFRKGEIFGLKWSDIDFDKKTISINRTCITSNHGAAIREDTKTKYSRRTIDITDGLVQKLISFRHWQSTYISAASLTNSYDGFIVTSETGTVKDPNSYTNIVFKRILKRAGLSHDIRFHDLRHTHATQLLQAGVDIKSVSHRLGHSSIRITLDTYAHVIPSMQDNVIQKLSELNLIAK